MDEGLPPAGATMRVRALRRQYRLARNGSYRVADYRLELFADVFNVLDNQDATRNQDLVAGAGGNAFGDGIRFTPPRRVFIGARLRFGGDGA